MSQHEWTQETLRQIPSFANKYLTTVTSQKATGDLTSVTRLGDFQKLLVINFTLKIAKIFGDFLGYFGKYNFLSEACWGHLLGKVLNYLGFYLFQHLVTLHAPDTHFTMIFFAHFKRSVRQYKLHA